jgi:serine/threonine-protein kinase CTR1
VSDYAVDTIRQRAKRNGVYTQPLWVAPEVLRAQKKPTKASDVFSFGIVLWEILTRRTPYQGMIKAQGAGGGAGAAHIKAIADIIAGMRPLLPDRTPAKMASLITRCWSADPALRPDFQTIVDELSEMEREKPAQQELHNQWLKNQAELEEIAIVPNGSSNSSGSSGGADEPESLEALLASSPEKKSWLLSSKELKYEEVIGRGSFGEVWLANWRGKKVAVKKMQNGAGAILKGGALLQNGGRGSPKNLFREFVKEVTLMCSLRHPNTVLFMGACVEEGHLALVMEYCAKKDLFAILQDKSVAIDYNLILKILTAIAEGLLYLHLHKPQPILHRDLKSANILVDEHWDVKISDYGLTDFKPDGVLSGDGGSDGAALQLGTPFWQSPEAMERGEFSEASDTYALGMIIFELFTREVPFRNLNPHQAALAVIAEDKRPDIPAFVPPKFAQLMQSCWQRDPKARPSMQSVLQSLAVLKAEGLPRIELTAHMARVSLYRKRTLVFAYKSKDSVIVYKPWGTGEGKKGDWVLVGPGDDVYTCDAAIFARTYSQVDASTNPHLYRKTGSIFALQMDRDFLMETLEGMEHGRSGDWIAQNPVDGEQWPIANKTFMAMYEKAPDQNPPPGTMTRAQAQMQRASSSAAAAAASPSKLGALQEEKEDVAVDAPGLTQRKGR